MIHTTDEEVEVIVKGDRIVRIVDPKTGRSYQLDRHDLTLSRTDDPDGLTVRLDGEREVVLRRDGTRIAVIRLEAKKENPEPVADGIRELRRFEGSRDRAIEGVAISPDSCRLLIFTSGPEETVNPRRNLRLYELGTGKKVAKLEGHAIGKPAISNGRIALSPDGKTAIFGDKKSVRIWNLSNGKVVSEWDTGNRVKAWESKVLSVAFSPDGQHAFSASFNGDVLKWDLATGKSVQFFQDAIIPSIAVSRKGTRLAIVAEPPKWAPTDWIERIRVFDVATVKELCAIPTHLTEFAGVCFSPDERQVAWGHADGTIRVWDIDADREVMQLRFVKDAPIHALAFSPDGKRLLATNRNGFMRLWDLRSGKPIAEYTAPSGIRVLAFTQDGQFAVTGNYDGYARLYRLPDSPLLAKGGEEESEPPAPEKVGEVRRFSEGIEKLDWRLRPGFTADGQGVYASSSSHPRAVMLWNRNTGTLISQFDMKAGAFGFSLSPDRKLMVMGCGEDGEVQVARAPGGTVLNRLNRLEGGGDIWSSAISPTCDRVAAGDEQRVHVWDRSSGKRVWSEHIGLAAHRGLAFSPDGAILAAGCSAPALVLFEPNTGKEIRRLEQNGCPDCAFTKDGKRLVAVCQYEVLIWDWAAGKLVRRIARQLTAIESMALAPDGRHLATGAQDGTVRWWDMDTGTEVQRFDAHPRGVLGVAVSPDGKELLSSGKDGTVRLWRLPDPSARKTIGKEQSEPPVLENVDQKHSHLLFNGRDLKGWVVDGDDAKAWSVEDGELVGASTETPNTVWLLTDRSYSDFRLRFEFRLTEGANSGVALRAVPGEKNVRNDTLPHHLEVQILDDDAYRKPDGSIPCPTGAIFWAQGDSSNLHPDRPANLKRVGSWNEMIIESRGATLQVWVNGRRITDADLDKLAHQSNALPGLKRSSGRIGFQRHTGGVRFRNIEITELPQPKKRTNSDKEGWSSLFNGFDLSGWNIDGPNGEQWSVEKGVIVGRSDSPESRSYLLTDKTYADFALRFDYKVEDGHHGVCCGRLKGRSCPTVTASSSIIHSSS